MSMPKKDSELVAFAANFDTKATATPATYSLTAPQALAFHNATLAYTAAYTAVADARAAGTRSKPLTAAKDTARDNLYAVGRPLYALIAQSTTVTDAAKEDIGVKVRAYTPGVVPAPGSAPGVEVVAVTGNTVRLRIYDTDRPTKRAKPPGIDGAALFSFVGAAAPADEAGWKFEGIVSRSSAGVVFPAGTPAGARVWFTAFWFNARKEQGPASPAVSTNIPGGAAMAA